MSDQLSKLRVAGSGWSPDLGSISRLAMVYFAHLNHRAARHVLHACGPSMSTNELKRLSASPPRTWSTPALAWCAHGRSTHSADQLILRDLRSVNGFAEPPPLTSADNSAGDWVAGGLAALTETFLRTGYFDLTTQRLVAVETPPSHLLQTTSAAAELLATCWPEAAAETQLLLRRVVFIQGDGMLSGSLPAAFGAVFFHEKLASHLVTNFEMLVHETAHHSLEVLLAFDPLLCNGATVARSPLRPDPRPLTQILHAAVVLRRICAGLEAAIPFLAPRDATMALGRLEKWHVRLLEGMAVLQDMALWTETGTQYFESLRLNVGEAPIRYQQ